MKYRPRHTQTHHTLGNLTAKAKRDLGSRVNKRIIFKQVMGLIHPKLRANEVYDKIIRELNATPDEERPRYMTIPPDMTRSGQPEHILISHYWELGESSLFLTGPNYGVYIPKMLVHGIGGEEAVSRIIALAGLKAVLSVSSQLDQEIYKKEIEDLKQSIQTEREGSE